MDHNGQTTKNLFLTFAHKKSDNNPSLPKNTEQKQQQHMIEDAKGKVSQIRQSSQQLNKIIQSSISLARINTDVQQNNFMGRDRISTQKIQDYFVSFVKILITQQMQLKKLIIKKTQLKNKNRVHIVSNEYRIPQVFQQISSELQSIYEKLQQFDIDKVTSQMQNILNINLSYRNSLNQLISVSCGGLQMEQKKEILKNLARSCLKQNQNIIKRSNINRPKNSIYKTTGKRTLPRIQFYKRPNYYTLIKKQPQENSYNEQDTVSIKKIQKYEQLFNQSKYQKIILFLNTINLQKSIQGCYEEQKTKRLEEKQQFLRLTHKQTIKQIQQNIQLKKTGNIWLKQRGEKKNHIFKFLGQKIKQLKKKYNQHMQVNKFANIKTLKKNIFNNLDLIVYLPTLMKATLLDIDTLNKSNQFAEISLKVQIKVCLPGFVNSPNYYEDLIKQKFQIALHNEDLVGDNCVLLNFKDQKKQNQSKLHFYRNASKYFESTHNWGGYNFQQNIFKQEILSFDGFIIVAEFNRVAVKVQPHDYLSPLEILDLCGIIQIKPIQVSLREMKNLLLIQDQSLLQLMYMTNPQLSIKFNLIDIYKQSVQLTPEINMNHINTTQNIVESGYNSAPNLMLMQFSSSSYPKYKLQVDFFNNKQSVGKNKGCCSRASIRWIKRKTDRQNQKKLMNKLLQKTQKSTQQQLNSSKTFKLKQLCDKLLQSEKKILQQKQKKDLQDLLYLQQQQLPFLKLDPHISQLEQKQLQKQKQRQKRIRKQLYQLLQQIFKTLLELTLNYKYRVEHTDKVHEQVSKDKDKDKDKNKDKPPERNLQKIKYQIYCIKSMQLSLIEIIQLDQDNTYNSFLQHLRRTQYNLLEIIKKLGRQKQNTIKCQTLPITQHSKEQKKKNRSEIYRAKQQLNKIEDYLKYYNKIKKQLNENQYQFDHWYCNSKARFHFPFYRYPITSLLLIFVSVVFLGLVTLFIYFQTEPIDSRLSNLATLLIAYVGMIAVMQTQVNSNRITCTQYIVYSTMISSITCLFYSLYVNFQRNPQSLDNPNYIPQPQYSIAFYVSVVATVLSLIYPIALIIYFRLFAEDRYRKIEKPLFKAHEKMFIFMPGSQQTQNYITRKKQSRRSQQFLNQSLPYLLTERLIGCLEKVLDKNAQMAYRQINERYKKFQDQQLFKQYLKDQPKKASNHTEQIFD